MKKIRFLLLWLITLLIGYSISFASYTPSFSNIKVTNNYDENSDELDLKFVINNVSQRPTSDYYMKVKINNRTYSSDLIYSSSSDTLTSNFSIDIDSWDLDDNYYINYYVLNSDSNTIKYSKTNFKLNISDYNDNLKWSNIKITNDYDNSSEVLKVNFALNDVKYTPTGNYYMKLKIDNQTYTSDLIYSSSTDKLYSFFNIDIDADDLDNAYYITYSIINDDENVLLYTKSNYKLIVWNKENISWSNMKVSNSYKKNDESLEMSFSLSNVKTKPKDTYYVSFKLGSSSDSTTYTSDLIYDPQTDKLYTSFFIDLNRDDLKSSYNVTYYVYNSKDVKQYSKTYRLNISNYSGIYSSNRYNNINWSNMKISSNYDRSNEELKLNFYINNINSQPSWDYYVKLYIDWNYYTSDLSYSSSSDKLYTTFYIDLDRDDLDSYYSYTYYVIDEEDETREYTSSSKKVYINNYNNNKNYYYNDDNNYYYNNDTDYYNYARNRINNVENKYSSYSDRKYYINKEIDKIDDNYNYTSTFRTKAIDIFENRIDYYNDNYNR